MGPTVPAVVGRIRIGLSAPGGSAAGPLGPPEL
jgi:hypothetical protein